MEKVCFVGDTHHLWKNFREEVERLDLRDTAIFHLGDGGFGFYPRGYTIAELTKQNEWLKQRNCIMYNIRGNHDNPIWFTAEAKMIEFFRAEDRKILPGMREDFFFLADYETPIKYAEFITTLSNIKFVPDYTVIREGGQNILCIGGAISIDRIVRKAGRDYFPNEVVAYKPSMLKNLRDVNVVATHIMPHFIPPFNQDSELIRNYATHDKNLVAELVEERQIMTKIYKDITVNNDITLWAYGHMHSWNNTFYEKTKFVCVPPNKSYKLL
jgi:hypothetical protein